MNVTISTLHNYFLESGGTLRTKGAVNIRMVDNVFSLDVLLRKDLNTGYTYELYDELHSGESFIAAYGIQSIDQLQLLSRSDIWLRYYAEAAEVIFTDGDDHSIHFRKLRNKTMVYSMELNYYTEAPKVFNMLEHFENYVEGIWCDIEELSYKK